MWSMGFIFLFGAFYACSEILQSHPVSADDLYVAELMVESNVTLEAKTILDILRDIKKLKVTVDGESHDVTFESVESTAECLIVGLETTCNCSEGYVWANPVCYNFSCCSDAPCEKNVSYIPFICVPKVPVRINGSVALSSGSWTSANEDTLLDKFRTMNGFKSLNVTGTPGSIADFEVELNLKFDTPKLQEVIDTLQTVLMANIKVDTNGMVNIEHPAKKVCYTSSPTLMCTSDQPSDKAGWNMSTTFERFELNDGSVVKLDKNCKTSEYPSCLGVTLHNVTGSWEGTYECGFTKGSVRHVAKAYLEVARLPDNILLTVDPITADCSEEDPNTGSVVIKATAAIKKTNNTYDFEWTYNSKGGNSVKPVDGRNGTRVHYKFDIRISCKKILTPHNISVTFKNDIKQKKSDSIIVPVIYPGSKVCEEDTEGVNVWPKTPDKDTAVSHVCPSGRVGYRTRTCENSKWSEVSDFCVNEELNKISNAADSFLKGLGATESVALDIFSGLANNTMGSSGNGDNIADLTASVNVLDMMARASKNVQLGPKVIPSFVGAASNMLNKTWEQPGINDSALHTMSGNYLISLEGLVENIGTDDGNSTNSTDFHTENIDLKYCQGADCNMSIFGIDVALNKTGGMLKTAAVKNLAHKLSNTRKNAEVIDILVSATLVPKNDKHLVLQMNFPATVGQNQKAECVFWDTEKRDFSSQGCQMKKPKNVTGNSSGVYCVCDHMTSFSVLMARGDVSNPVLDVITYVGLGVSIVSLVLFLIIEYLVWGAVVKTKLSHYRHTAMVNIALFLLLANICFLATIEPSKLSPNTCLVLTLCKHLFYLAKFCWMFCLSAMLVHQLIFVFSPLRKKVFMYLSSIVGYMVPIVIVIVTYIYYKYTNESYYNEKLCWLTFESLLVGSLHAFILPIGVIILSNIFSLGVVIVTLLKSSKNDSSKTDEKDTAKSIIKVILVLAPVFGVTWSIGFCLVVFDAAHPAYPFFNYTFTIVNSFQGLFVLLTGFMAEQKVKDELYKRITGNKNGSSDTTKNIPSTMYTKDK